MDRIITPSELKGRSLPELRALFHEVQQQLVCSDDGSQERRNALTSLDTISRAMAQRMRFTP
ncbi:MAG: hypothetical protein QNI84_17415 [Henriciella sp.]|nr:hypothetical protein [Henriciella sp.]